MHVIWSVVQGIWNQTTEMKVTASSSSVDCLRLSKIGRQQVASSISEISPETQDKKGKTNDFIWYWAVTTANISIFKHAKQKMTPFSKIIL